jgi:regulator of cell morphogenesis and NO signaling
MLITADMKLADAIHYNHLLLPVINRLGVQLGFGDKSIQQICEEKAIDPDFFLMIINAFLDHDINKTLKIKSVSIHKVVEYLKATHQYYLERMIPEVENRINALIQHSMIDQKQFLLVKNFFEEYKNELYVHVKLEEQSIYPYVIAVFDALESGHVDESLRKKMQTEPIDSYAEEHSDIESKLFDLKNILIKYLPESGDSYLRNQVLNALFKLENDLNDHSRMENMVLVPRIAEIEKQLLKS